VAKFVHGTFSDKYLTTVGNKIDISPEQVSEAIQYRSFDRTLWV
jgi:hypothetical protein